MPKICLRKRQIPKKLRPTRARLIELILLEKSKIEEGVPIECQRDKLTLCQALNCTIRRPNIQ